jgi:hypothetical protein
VGGLKSVPLLQALAIDEPDAKLALALGLIAIVLSIVHLTTSAGAVFGSGSGKAGAIFGVVLGFIGMILGGMALRKNKT